jgi:hypothetical protein
MTDHAGTRVPVATAPVWRIPRQSARRLADARPVECGHGYWFPMLVFGLLILLAPLLYQPASRSAVTYVWHPVAGTSPRLAGIPFAPMQQFGTCDGALGDPMTVALYWFCVVMFGPLVSLLWYHRRARRTGTSRDMGWYLLYACSSLALYVVLFPVIEFVAPHVASGSPAPGTAALLQVLTVGGFVAGLAVAARAALPLRAGQRLSRLRWAVSALGMLLAIASAATVEFLTFLSGRPNYGGLLIIGVGLLALSLVERGTVCFVVAAVFTAAALAANVVGFRRIVSGLGLAHHWSSSGTALANLLVPGLVLLAGAAIGGLIDARRRPV